MEADWNGSQKRNQPTLAELPFPCREILDKVKINKELKDLDLKKNLERKIELVKKPRNC
jgi:hypothetical protein